MHGLDPVQRPFQQISRGASPDVLVGRTDVEQPLLGNPVDPEHFPDMLGQLAKPLLAVAQGAFHLDASGDLVLQGLVDGRQFRDARPDPFLQLVVGAPQLLLGPFQGGNIAGDAEDADHPPLGVPVGPFGGLEDEHIAAQGKGALAVQHGAAGQYLAIVVHQPAGDIGGNSSVSSRPRHSASGRPIRRVPVELSAR